VTGKLETDKDENTCLVCVEPAQIPIEGILPAWALNRVSSNTHQTVTAKSQHSHADRGSSSSAYVMLANFTEEPLIIPKARVLGVAEEVPESLVDRVNTPTKCSLSSRTKPPRTARATLCIKSFCGENWIN
jgi:hypothetical protein